MPDSTASWATGVQAITLFVDDLGAAKRFYLDVFELPIAFEDSQAVTLKLGTTLINLLVRESAPELIEPSPVAEPASGSRMMLTIEVPDTDAVASTLKSRGVALLNGPIDRPWGVRTAAFSDPSGHVWEIAAPIRKA